MSPAAGSSGANGSHPVSDETRTRVLAAIDQIGYRPSAVARSLALSRTNSDLQAIGALRAIEDSGRRAAVAVAGFDDVRMSAQTFPPLTTVTRPFEATADAAG
ncbi:substrate-binding domain-containing protein [Dactylosporangium sp. CA-233914]|uniref:substrate-binding domain-containing protein n=1 Tax=Dactylosporangium sp. CA-233914 TaxID=3239934 RepID=UPI003D8ACD34